MGFGFFFPTHFFFSTEGMKLLNLFFFFLLVQCIHIVQGDSLTINNANDWKTLITQTSRGSFPDEIILGEDLDLSTIEFSPLGINEEGDCVPFTGTFNGNSHTIQNIKMDKTEDTVFSHAGLFCGLGHGATVENVIIDDTCSFTGTTAGALSPSAFGSVTIRKVTTKASVNGIYVTSGLIGSIANITQADIIFDTCVVNGSVSFNTGFCTAGGFISTIKNNTEIKITITNSSHGGIVKVPNGFVGGFIGYGVINTKLTILFEESKHTGFIPSGGWVGGFIGMMGNNEEMSIVLKHVSSEGLAVQDSKFGDWTGGFIGKLDSNTNSSFFSQNATALGVLSGSLTTTGSIGCMVGDLSYNRNFEFVTEYFKHDMVLNAQCNSEMYMGGIIGNVFNNDNITIIDVVSKSNTSFTATSYSPVHIGSTIGRIYSNNHLNLVVNDGMNTGTFDGKSNAQVRIGGFVGLMGSNNNVLVIVTHITNTGNLHPLTDYAPSYGGGVFGACENNENITITITDGVNHGAINGDTSASGHLGGVSGSFSQNKNVTIEISAFVNKGALTSNSFNPHYCGGIVGEMNSNNGLVLSISNTTNNGIVNSTSRVQSYIGGFVGQSESNPAAKVIVKDSANNGILYAIGLHSFIGGLFGSFDNKDSIVTLEGWQNNGDINTSTTQGSSFAGGVIGSSRDSENTHLIFKKTVNSGIVNALSTSYVYVGGMIGYINSCNNLHLIMEEGKNNQLLNGTSTTGRGYIGGLIGWLVNNKNAVVTFKQSTNDGDVNVTSSVYGCCGGMAGRISENNGLSLTINDVINNGNINGTNMEFAGGLVGALLSNQPTIAIRNATNNGDIFVSSGSNDNYGGGLFAQVAEYSGTTLQIIGGVNTGAISFGKATGHVNVGGLVGNVNSGVKVALSHCFNTGNLNIHENTGAVGGLIGRASQGLGDHLQIDNSGNAGALEATESTASAAGLFVSFFSTKENVVVEVNNSFSKGPISGNGHVYGVSNLATAARNVVSMGTLAGQAEDVHSFWPSCDDAAMLYGLDDGCVNCENATLFAEQADGRYCLKRRDGCVPVDDELNKGAAREQYAMLWTRELELAEPVAVAVGAPYTLTMSVLRGDTVQHAFALYGLSLDGFFVVDRRSWQAVSTTTAVEQDMDLALCHEVVVRNVAGGRWLAEHGRTLGSIAGLDQHLDARHMGVDAADAARKYDRDTVLTQNLAFDLAWKPRVAVKLPPTDPSQVNAADVVRDVLGVVGGPVGGLGVEARTNGDGLVDEVDIFVFEDDAAQDIANKVNDLNKGAGCTAGVLCKSKGAHVVYGDPSSATRAASAAFVIFIVSALLFFF